MQLAVFFKTITKMVMLLLCQQSMGLQKKIMNGLRHKCDPSQKTYLNPIPARKFKHPKNTCFRHDFFFYLFLVGQGLFSIYNRFSDLSQWKEMDSFKIQTPF